MTTSPTLFLATPCYDKKVTDGYCISIQSLTVHLMRNRISSQLKLVGNESLITRARNNLFAEFLSRAEFSHLLFIDADLSFPPEAVTQLLDLDKELCGCLYPKKRICWDRVSTIAGRPGGVEESEIREIARDYVVDLVDPAAQGTTGSVVEVKSLGTGFLLISRSCAERMCEAYRETLSYRNDIGKYNKQSQTRFQVAVFDTMIEPETGRYLSEDYAFCRRWRDVGGRIFANLEPRLEHIGTMTY